MTWKVNFAVTYLLLAVTNWWRTLYFPQKSDDLFQLSSSLPLSSPFKWSFLQCSCKFSRKNILISGCHPPWIVSPWAPFLYRPSYATTCNQTVGPMFSKCQLSERFPRADRPTYFLSPQYQCLFLRSGTLGTTQSLAPPRLYKVALKSVTLLATSASVEHVFSSRGMFMWLHRAQVSYLIFVWFHFP